MFSQITPLVLTYNESSNIGRTLARLKWAREIVLVDSFSTDETLSIVQSAPQTKLFQRKFDTFASQCNYGLDQVASDWVLSLDADYVLSEELIQEIADLRQNPDVVAYRVRFAFCVDGKPLRATLYPPRVVLYRKSCARYADDGHAHKVQVQGKIQDLNGIIYHDDRKPLDRWLSEQNRYMIREVQKLNFMDAHQLSFTDRLRKKIVIAPVAVFLYTLIYKRLILDGWPGWFYVLQRTLAETLLSLRLVEAKLKIQPATDVSVKKSDKPERS